MTTLEGTPLFDALVSIGEERGREEGKAEGKAEAIDTLFSLLEDGYSLEEAREIIQNKN